MEGTLPGKAYEEMATHNSVEHCGDWRKTSLYAMSVAMVLLSGIIAGTLRYMIPALVPLAWLAFSLGKETFLRTKGITLSIVIFCITAIDVCKSYLNFSGLVRMESEKAWVESVRRRYKFIAPMNPGVDDGSGVDPVLMNPDS